MNKTCYINYSPLTRIPVISHLFYLWQMTKIIFINETLIYLNNSNRFLVRISLKVISQKFSTARILTFKIGHNLTYLKIERILSTLDATDFNISTTEKYENTMWTLSLVDKISRPCLKKLKMILRKI
jgi:hypothetical protein